jgi:cytoskeletal protein CcmA (bactofilin family)
MVMNCEISFHGMLRVDGHLTGRVESDDGVLIVSSTGTVDAGIKVAVAVVDGIVRGDIYASERIEIGSRAQVIGDIQTPSLSLAEGGILDGNCHFMMPGIVASPSATEVSRPQLARNRRDSEAKKNSTGSDSDKPTVLAAMVGHC